MTLLENKFVKKVVNIPSLWNAAQNFVGSNQWKAKLYTGEIQGTGTLLDFGCSIGNETEHFLNLDYYGVDVDRNAIEAAKKRFSQFPQVKFFSLDIINDGFKKDFFDHVLIAATGHHLTDEQLSLILGILYENLKPGGLLHFFDVIVQPKDNWSARMFARIDQGRHMRSVEEYQKIFFPYIDCIVTQKLFPSPDNFIKLQDMLYIRLEKPSATQTL